ncbi:MAG: FtsX-like permease family protein [Deinococcales bacterium]
MLNLAWRNIWRQRRRSVTTAAAVALVVLISILFYSMGGALTNSFYQDVTQRAGHLQVHVAGYRDLVDVRDRLMRPAGALQAAIERDAPGAVVFGVLQVPALMGSEARSRGIAVLGEDRPAALGQSGSGRTLTAGRLPAPGDLTGVALGAALAEALHVGVGDEVSLYAPGTEGTGAGLYRVVGLVHLDDPSTEASTAYLSLAAAQELAAPDAVERFEIHYPSLHDLRSEDLVFTTADRLRQALGSSYAVETWRQLDPTLLGLVKAMNPILYGMSLFFYVLAGLLVMNTVYLSLIERVREFGLVIALGAEGRQVVRMILSESILLCLTGAAVGLAAGLGAVAALAPGFTLPGFEGLYQALGISPVLYPSVTGGQVAFALVFAVATAVLAALWPALLATRIEPVEAMRHTA